MEIFELKNEFDRIIKENDFSSKEKLEKILEFLKQGSVNLDEFSNKFNLNRKDSRLFLEFLQKGIEFKKNIEEK